MPSRRWILSACLALVSTAVVQAQEVGLLGGALAGEGGGADTYAWQAVYRHEVHPRVGLSFGWFNEGHLPEHHRDGAAIQAWTCLAGWDRPWTLALGLGPYRWFDTRPLPVAGDFEDRHGVGAIASLQLIRHQAGSRLSWQAQVTRTLLSGHEGTTSLLVGGAYRFGAPFFEGRRGLPERPDAVPRHQVAILAGRTIQNSLRSEGSEAWMAEYRYALSRHWALAAAYVDEGDTGLLRRDGLSLQAWVGGAFLADRLYLGVGAGPHLDRVSLDPDGREHGPSLERMGLRASVGAGWRLDAAWMLRGTFSRTVSTYDRDTDLLLMGLGYVW
jgi:hypothetical protein